MAQFLCVVLPLTGHQPHMSCMNDGDATTDATVDVIGDVIVDIDEREVYTVPCSGISLLMRGVEADVLEIMSKAYSSHSASSVAAATGRSRNQVSAVLKFYAESGILRTITMGNRRWYMLNRDSSLYSTVRALGAMRFMRR